MLKTSMTLGIILPYLDASIAIEAARSEELPVRVAGHSNDLVTVPIAWLVWPFSAWNPLNNLRSGCHTQLRNVRLNLKHDSFMFGQV